MDQPQYQARGWFDGLRKQEVYLLLRKTEPKMNKRKDIKKQKIEDIKYSALHDENGRQL